MEKRDTGKGIKANNERSSNVQAYNDLEGHWIEEDVKVVEENDPGADGGFHPDEFVTRAQLVKVVRRLQGY